MSFSLAKKILCIGIAAGMFSLSLISPLQGQGSTSIEMLLQQILQRVNNLPASLVQLGTYIENWTNADTTDTSSSMKTTFQQLGQLISQDEDTQLSLQPGLNGALFGNDGSNALSLNGGKPAKTQAQASLTFANDITYSSLLGAPYFAKDPRPNVNYAQNYVLNASGSNLYHALPTPGWHGSSASVMRYQSYYNTIMAATSFNNYVLSGVYADKGQFTTLQKSLITQASDPSTWFAKVASENIGVVLRQLLMYQSQVFVLLTEMIQLQRDTLSAQAMNTSVLIANGQLNESTLAASAQGTQPTL